MALATLLKDAAPGMKVRLPLLVKSVAFGISKKGSPYALGVAGDATGSVAFAEWSVDEDQKRMYVPGCVIEFTGTWSEYDGKPQLVVKSTAPSEADSRRIDFYEHAPVPVADMLNALVGHLQMLDEPIVSELVAILTRDYSSVRTDANSTRNDHACAEIVARFLSKPAAKGMHHAYVGGLFEHTLGVVRNAIRIAGGHNVDMAMVLVGAVLHDIGKIYEYDLSGQLTDRGMLVGHAAMGVQIANELLGHVMSPEDRMELEHIIVSHHGRQEWGAVIEPKTPEAFIVHIADLVDVRMWHVGQFGDVEGWQESRMFGGKVFL